MFHFLTDMDDRAAERARLKAERDEKRRQAEEERLVTNINERAKNNSLSRDNIVKSVCY